MKKFYENIKKELIFKKYLKNQIRKEYAIWDDVKFNKQNYNLDYIELWKTAPKASPFIKKRDTNVIYQILVYNFADGNNDGIGDFIGLKNKIPYLVDLGVDQLWLSPIHSASSYHGYSVIDYCDVAEQLGGMTAFIDFLSEAHKNGIKVYLDLVFNHTSYEHPWFQEALYGNKKFEPFYRFEPNYIDHDVKTDTPEVRSKYIKLDQNKKATNRRYLGRFTYGMPDLNLDNKDVIDQLIGVQKFWTAVGVDGFRYDAFAEFYSSEQETKNNFNEAKIFSLLRKASNEITNQENGRDEVFMMGEWVHTDSLKALEYTKYNDEFALDTVYDGFKFFRHNPDVRVPFEELYRVTKMYQDASTKSKWIPFLDNHDVLRWLDSYRMQVSKLKGYQNDKKLTQSEKDAHKIAMMQLLVLPGTPLVYYGNELMYYGTREYGDPSLREPMKWDKVEENSYIFDNKVKESTKDHVLLTSALSLQSADEAQKDKDSLFNFIKFMIELRNANSFISKTDVNTIINPYEVIDSQDYSSFTVRADSKNANRLLLFGFCNYQNPFLHAGKISRKFHFKPLYMYKAKNNSWNIEIEQGGIVIFELIRK
ncbi:alpha-amylase 3 [Mycoplasmopsis canis PG 14]|uniref:Alpha-amylase n=1 Tax=Mycoplasmopsis canis TaxID=29555 RepID=A0A449AQI3_9BACT|nr:alpha-amylase family glycosyl hydrolase [Mycoplasmopsis canis]AMD81391.1 alpha-amlyase [Mycoplasmopsis canis PG 14]EIE40867.1 alpha-amylase 3 [Mycoplasmopsis canis PG 14]VEU68626.1 Alpha-amylase precursor [Mycoplasmopsis canis]